MLDENHGYDIKLLDVSDFSNITVLSTLNSGVDTSSMAHNAIIKGNLLFVSYYHDGLRIFNITDPYNPVQVCNYDTYPHSMTYCAIHNNHLGYKGAWGVYPNLPSSILISDMQTGLYVFDSALPLAVNNFEQIASLVFPNPAKNHFTIENREATSIVLYDFLGKRVLQQNLTNSKTIERGNLSGGMYFYSLRNQKRIIENGKIIFK